MTIWTSLTFAWGKRKERTKHGHLIFSAIPFVYHFLIPHTQPQANLLVTTHFICRVISESGHRHLQHFRATVENFDSSKRRSSTVANHIFDSSWAVRTLAKPHCVWFSLSRSQFTSLPGLSPTTLLENIRI